VSKGGNSGLGGGSGENVLESAYRPLRDSPGFLDSCQRAAHLSLRPPPEPLVLGAIAGAPLLLSIVEIARSLRRRREKAAPARRGMRAHRAAAARLREARNLLKSGQTERGYEALAATLLGYLEDRAGEPLAGLSLPELTVKLASLGVDEGAARATVQALEAQESARYAPGDRTREAETLLAATETALAALEKSGLRRTVRAA